MGDLIKGTNYDDDAGGGGVRPPFPVARSARWFPAHPLIWLPRQPVSRSELARCRQLLGMPACPPTPEESQHYRDRYAQLTGGSLRECPGCHQGRMVALAVLGYT